MNEYYIYTIFLWCTAGVRGLIRQELPLNAGLQGEIPFTGWKAREANNA